MNMRVLGAADIEMLDLSSRNKMKIIADLQPPTVTLLIAEHYDIRINCATLLAKYWINDSLANEYDLVIAVPDGRWSVEQIKSLVIDPIRNLAIKRRVIIVDRIDEIDDKIIDVLLKIIEQPDDITTAFILLAKNEEEIKTTIRGRVSERIELKTAEDSDRTNWLIKNGFTKELSAEIVKITKGMPMSAEILAGDEKLFRHAKQLHDSIDNIKVMPASRALNDIEHIEQLSKGLAKLYGDSDRGQRVAKRALVEAHLDKIRKNLIEKIILKDYDCVAQKLQACDRANESLENNGQLSLIMTLCYSIIAN
jgi:hypothetical protein